MGTRGRLALLVAAAGLWLLATGPAAAAHGSLRSSEPAGGSSLERAPAAVILHFSERPDPDLSTVRVLDSGGRVVAGGPARPVAGRPLELQVPTAGLPAGGYTVSWRIVSAVGGHRTDGEFAFGVGAAATPPLPAGRPGCWGRRPRRRPGGWSRWPRPPGPTPACPSSTCSARPPAVGSCGGRPPWPPPSPPSDGSWPTRPAGPQP